MARFIALPPLAVALSLALTTACMTTAPASGEVQTAQDKADATKVWEFAALTEARVAGESAEQGIARYCATDHHPRVVQVAISNMTSGAADNELGPGGAIRLLLVGCRGGKQTYAGTFDGTYEVEGETLWLTGDFLAAQTDEAWGDGSSVDERNILLQLDYAAFDERLDEIYFDAIPPAVTNATSAFVATLHPSTLGAQVTP